MFWGNPHRLLNFGRVNDHVGFARALAGPQDANPAAHELHHVFVAGDDVNVDVAARRLAGERADHVIGLIPGNFDNGQAHGFAQAPNKRNLNKKLIGHGLALSFIVGKKLVAESWAGGVKDYGYIIRL